MNPELLKERLPFIQALADGKTVQTNSHWGRYPSNLVPSMLGVEYMAVTAYYIVTAPSDVKFRIKPERQEWWLHRIDSMSPMIASETPLAAGIPCIHVREVLPDSNPGNPV